MQFGEDRPRDLGFFGVGDDQIDAGQSRDGLGRHLRVTAGRHHQRFRRAAPRLADDLTRRAIAQVGDGARVDDDDIGCLALGGWAHPLRDQLRRDGFAICMVDFAA